MAKTKNFFNFLGGDKGEDGIATGGNPKPSEPAVEPVVEIATGGNPTSREARPDKEPKIHQGLTKAQVLEAQRRAESVKGLDMAKFMKETGVVDLNFDQLIRYKVV